MIALNNDIKRALRESFEARGYQVEFKDDRVLVTKDGKTERIPNEKVMQYIEAFNPKD